MKLDLARAELDAFNQKQALQESENLKEISPYIFAASLPVLIHGIYLNKKFHETLNPYGIVTVPLFVSFVFLLGTSCIDTILPIGIDRRHMQFLFLEGECETGNEDLSNYCNLNNSEKESLMFKYWVNTKIISKLSVSLGIGLITMFVLYGDLLQREWALSKIQTYRNSDHCLICRGEFDESNPRTKLPLPCGHNNMHSDCQKESLSYSNLCPECRQPI